MYSMYIMITLFFLLSPEAVATIRTREQDRKVAYSAAKHSIKRDARALTPRNIQLARQLSPQRTFTRMGHFGQFRTLECLRAQRHYLHRRFRGHNWHWWWRHRPHIFYAYFPFFFYNTYGYYPPIYYDYFDVYGVYPAAYSHRGYL
jgi:hypothetical protein